MLRYWLAASLTPKFGPRKIKVLLEQFQSIEEVCKVISAPLDLADKEIEKAEKEQIQIFSLDDDNYPEFLKKIHDPPPVLYVKGKLEKSDKNAVAIVGTRTPTNYGLEAASFFAKELSKLGLTIISGLALGIDACAHQGALAQKGRTLAVLGSAVDEIYPRQNLNIADDILSSGNAIVSEYKLGTKPDKWTFPMRNRVIAGLSYGVIVVEGGVDSGSLITAKLALDEGREVFAVPGNIFGEESKGPHQLIKQGAKLVESVEDVLEEIKQYFAATRIDSPAENLNIYEDLSEEEKALVLTLSKTPKHIDDILSGYDGATAKASSLITMLEIKQKIKQLPGKFYVII